MAIAKVILNGVTQMDVTGKTVTAGTMLSGTTALKNDGTDVTGDIASKTSSNMTVSGATVTAPAGYYASAASKSVASGSATTPATTITANPTVSVNSSGLITATVSKTQSVTPSVSAGYVSSGTAGTITVSGSGTSQLTTQAAQTIHPSTTDQTIASGKYLTGAQTIKAVTTTNLTAANIMQGVTVKIGDSTDDDCVASVTGTAATGGDDFVITLTKNASTGIWEPDCTFAEAKAAYDAGKEVAFVATEESDGYIIRYPCMSDYINDQNPCIYYSVNFTDNDFVSTYTCTQYSYYWYSTGVQTGDYNPVFYNVDNATAVPADVASGKVFYNANGYQVGTASGGGGLDASYKAVIERTAVNPTLPDDLTKIGQYAFSGCSSLAITSLPSGVTSIDSYAFDGCSYLALTSLPTNMATIGAYAFRNCNRLALSSLPNSITSIGNYAFYNCAGLTLTALPSGLTVLSEYVFYGCTNIAISSLPTNLTTVSAYAFYNCYGVTVSSLPDTVTYIGTYAFRGCEGMTGISGNGAITMLGSNAFYGLSGHLSQLKYARFPNMIASNIGAVFGSSTATNACQQLELADIGSAAAIGADAFRRCYNLQTLIIRKSDAICTLANTSALYDTPIRGYSGLSGTIYVPSALISTYQTATNWSTIYGEGHVTFAAIEGSQYEL